jgi:hypothetical protein
VEAKGGGSQSKIVRESQRHTKIVRTKVKYVPELWVSLFSIAKALQNGFNIGNTGIQMFLVKGDTKLTFN